MENDTRNREIVGGSSSMSSTNFVPSENIASEIKDNCKIIEMHNSDLSQNLEGLTKLFVREAVPPNYFFVRHTTRRVYNQLLSINGLFSLIFLPSIIQWPRLKSE
jgi:hypothetical protein